MKPIPALLALCALFQFGLPGPSARAAVPPTMRYEGRIAVSGAPFQGVGQFKFALVDPGVNLSRKATAVATVTSGFVTDIAVTDGGVGYTSAPTVRILGRTGAGAVATATENSGSVVGIQVVNAGLGYSGVTVEVEAPPVNLRYVTYWSNDGSSVQGSEPIASVPVSVQRGLYSVNLGDVGLPNMTAIPASAFASGQVRLRVWFSDGVHGFQQVVPDQPLASAPFARLAEKVVDGGVTGLQVEDGSLGLADLNLTDLDTRYLPKSGGIMTGRLVVDNLISANRGIETSGILPDGFLFTVNARGSIWMILDADNPGVSYFRVTDPSTRSLFEVDDVGNANLVRDLTVGGRLGVGMTSFDADAAVQFNLPAAGTPQYLKLKSPSATAGFGMRFVNPGMTFGIGLNPVSTSDQRFVLSPEASGKGLVIAPNGNVGIDSANAPLPFAALTVNGTIGFTSVATPAMYVYDSGTANPQKPLLMHSPGYPGYGLYYRDDGDRFEMKSSATDATPSLVVDLDSNWVAIGSLVGKPGYELSVKGQIVCQDLLLENPPTWADHVFEEGYPLKPLEEVETHIREKKHLPGVPSAAEVSRDGILLGEMQSKLLEKIEELTLHLIEQNKRLRAQDERIRELESRLGERAPAAR